MFGNAHNGRWRYHPALPACLSILQLGVSTMRSGTSSQAFDLSGGSGGDDDTLPYRPDFFHTIFLLASCYMVRLGTGLGDWGLGDWGLGTGLGVCWANGTNSCSPASAAAAQCCCHHCPSPPAPWACLHHHHHACLPSCQHRVCR